VCARDYYEAFMKKKAASSRQLKRKYAKVLKQIGKYDEPVGVRRAKSLRDAISLPDDLRIASKTRK